MPTVFLNSSTTSSSLSGVRTSNPDAYRLTPHFEASPAFLLIWLEHIDEDEVRERLIDAWLIKAPKRLAAQHSFD